jgi:hypothetical protein
LNILLFIFTLFRLRNKTKKKETLGWIIDYVRFFIIEKGHDFFFFFWVVSFCFVGYYKNSRGNMMVGWRGRGGGIKERKLSCVGRRCVISLNILQNIFFFFRLLLFFFWLGERLKESVLFIGESNGLYRLVFLLCLSVWWIEKNRLNHLSCDSSEQSYRVNCCNSTIIKGIKTRAHFLQRLLNSTPRTGIGNDLEESRHF